MKAVLLFWGLPVSFLGLWYGLSANDLGFGLWFFSREMHDLVFTLYGDILGIAPEAIPPLVARAIVLDTFLVFGILAFRRRRAIAAFLRDRRLVDVVRSAKGGDPVERPLQNEGRSRRIDARRPFGTRDVRRDQDALGGDGGQPLVPEGQRPVVQG